MWRLWTRSVTFNDVADRAQRVLVAQFVLTTQTYPRGAWLLNGVVIYESRGVSPLFKFASQTSRPIRVQGL
jgi:hypothetical protein